MLINLTKFAKKTNVLLQKNRKIDLQKISTALTLVISNFQGTVPPSRHSRIKSAPKSVFYPRKTKIKINGIKRSI